MMSEIDRSRMSTKLHRKRCKVCGEVFNYYPYWHQWMAKVNGSHYEAVCRYNCMRKVENAADEKAERKEREREERRHRREEEKSARMASVQRERPKIKRAPAWYEEQIAISEIRRDEMAFTIKLLKNRGEWKNLSEKERRAKAQVVRYNENRIKELSEELNWLRQEKGYEE